jgi:hypothetical protein
LAARKINKHDDYVSGKPKRAGAFIGPLTLEFSPLSKKRNTQSRRTTKGFSSNPEKR